MDILWEKDAWDDYQYWIDNDRKVLHKINILIKECQRTPFEGTGKPEALRQNFSGYWSRRITGDIGLFIRSRMIFYTLPNVNITIKD